MYNRAEGVVRCTLTLACGDRTAACSARGKREEWRGTALTLLLLLALLPTCSPTHGGADHGAPDAAATPVSAVDDAGRTVRLPSPARRIVSLVPAATETLFALGAGEWVVARTDYDRAPQMAHVPSVGGGLDPSFEALLALRPDLVLTWEEAGSARLRPMLEELGISVFALSTHDTTDIFRNLERLGRLTGRDGAADSLARRIRSDLEAVRSSVSGLPRRAVFFVAAVDPPMTAGPHTFIAQLLEIAGAETVFPDLRSHWPQLSLEEIVRRQPEVVVLPIGEWSGDAVGRMRSAPGWRELEAVREGRIVTVPAELVNRPGPRIAESARVLRDALHPTLQAHRP